MNKSVIFSNDIKNYTVQYKKRETLFNPRVFNVEIYSYPQL